MMSILQSVHRYLLSGLAGTVLAACTFTTIAHAETYGQLGHFGSAGTGHVQFKIKSGTRAFGVDLTDNSVYVGDELKGGEYRIQKLTSGGAYVAQTVFKASNHDGIEGIAIDPAEKRVYVLAIEKREILTIDPAKPAAGTLYAFSTEPSGEAIVPASGTIEGVLAGANTLEPQSDALEVALLNPAGITVDPTTHDVIILGGIDEGEVKGEPQLRVALQRVHSNGTLGERYVDNTDFFDLEATPNSPTVSPKGAVYVAVQQPQVTFTGTSVELAQDELVQIPSDFTSTAPPTPFVQFTLKGAFEEEGHPVVEFDSNEPTSFGGGLSFAPESTGEGRFYARAHIFVGTSEGKGSSYPGVLVFNVANGSEVGWTGGQTKQAGESCAISFGGETYPSVAAGSEHKVFVFDPGKPTFPVSPPRVVEFGPGGNGCPMAEATEPEATINGQLLSPSEVVSAGTSVAFSSTLTQANALSVDWNFGDGQMQTEGVDEYRHTKVKHKFVQSGELTVTETIHTDDLATPTIVKQMKISISATSSPPTAVLEGPLEVTLGGGAALGKLIYLEDGGLGLEEATQSEEATFDASASSASTAIGPNRIEAYHWVFGDGSSETTTDAITKHPYEKAGVYRVELTVTDALGLISEPTTLTVKVNELLPVTPKSPESVSGTPGQLPAAPPATTANHSLPAPANGLKQSPIPEARLVSMSLAVSSAGTIGLSVTCPANESSCAGTVTLRTLGAVRTNTARARKHGVSVLTLATGAFKVVGGRQESIKLRLSAKGRILLAHARFLHVRATIAAHNPAGMTHTTQTIVTIHAPQATHRQDKR